MSKAKTATATTEAKTKKTAAVATPAVAGAKKKDGLRKPQIRVLECLAKAQTPITRKQIAEQASVDNSSLSGYIGAFDTALREADDKAKGWKSLISLGYVKVGVDEELGMVHSISATGRKALEKANK